MTSDATNMQLRIERDGDHYVLNGRKWWSSNIMHPHNKLLITMGVSNTMGRVTSATRW